MDNNKEDETKMGGKYFMACKTCTNAEWIALDQIEAYINKHTGHQFHLIGEAEFRKPDHFTKWFMTFMDWSQQDQGER